MLATFQALRSHRWRAATVVDSTDKTISIIRFYRTTQRYDVLLCPSENHTETGWEWRRAR